jgi:hypothetical protein
MPKTQNKKQRYEGRIKCFLLLLIAAYISPEENGHIANYGIAQQKFLTAP